MDLRHRTQPPAVEAYTTNRPYTATCPICGAPPAVQCKDLPEYWVHNGRTAPSVTDEQHRADERATALVRLNSAAGVCEVFGLFLALFGLVGGIGLGVYSEDSGFDGNSHPYIGLGVAVALISVIVGTVIFMFGRWASAWVEMQR